MEGIEKWQIRRQVSESDPIYQEERERSKTARSNDIFGANELAIYNLRKKTRDGAQRDSETVEQNLKPKERTDVEPGEYLRQSFKKLAEDLNVLLAQEGYEDRKTHVLGEVGVMFRAPEVQDELRKLFGNDLSEFTAENLFIKLNDGSISDEFMYAVAKHHIEDIHKQEAQLERITEETKIEFKTAITDAVSNGFLPEVAAEALHRIDSVTVNLFDRLLAMSSSTLAEAGHSGKIAISNEQLQPHLILRLKKTLFHEFLHELSGKSVTVRTTIDGPYEFHHVFHRKSGVALNDPDLWYSPNRWLNEAITEWLAVELSRYTGDTSGSAYKGSSSYPTERQELDYLFASGLEQDVVTNAYFENFSSDEPKGAKGKHFAALVQRVNAIEGQAGFSKLENKHIMYEIEHLLYTRYVHPIEHVDLNKETLPPDTKIFHISVSVGTSEQTKITRRFVYMAKPITAGSIYISVADQWRSVDGTLSFVDATYRGKATYSVVEE